MGVKRMGFEGQILMGTAGSTAATLLSNGVRDITLGLDLERGDTTHRGDSSGPPIKTSAPSARIVAVEFTMLNDTTDANISALKVHAAAATGLSLRLKDHASGMGPDSDFTISAGLPWPLNGEQVITFTAEPSNSYGREPQNYV